jgi:hypothetical protein
VYILQPHTAIFPYPYSYKNRKNDSSLGNLIKASIRQSTNASYITFCLVAIVIIKMSYERTGPGGDLRLYLEGLATADDVSRFVREHPFGQPPITQTDPNWNFYKRVLLDE